MSTGLRRVLLVSAATLPLVLGGCPPWLWPPADGTPQSGGGLRPFGSADELLQYFKEQATARQRNAFWGPGLPVPGAADDAAEGDGQAGGGEQDYTTTNLQEAGVDEGDVFKSDGAYFYIAKARTLRIVDATPLGELAEVGRVDFETTIDALYLYGSRVIALGQRYTWETPGGDDQPLMWPPYYAGASVVVYGIDVSDPTAPEVVAENELDGSLVSSRLTGGRLILVLTIEPELPGGGMPLAIGLMTLDDVLPKMRVDGAETIMVPPGDWLRPDAPDGYLTTAVVTLDAADVTSVVGSVAILAGAGTIYASPEALYVTDTSWDAADNYRETTTIHKLAFNDQGVAEYTASGTVPGRLLNQFSLGEFEGFLRVATHVTNWGFFGGWREGPIGIGVAGAGAADRAQETDGDDGTGDGEPGDDEPGDDAPPAPEAPYNAVYVLGEAGDGALEIVGAIEDIAPGEDLYAARFLGPRGFLVTFLQIDPLFVLDLTDPASPAVAGELEIPGYSDYLHPYGEDLLIGVGRSTAELPWGGVVPNAVQLSLFDVSDLANPALIEQVTLGGYGSWCDVSFTHKAFTFLEGAGLLAVPVELWSDSGDPRGGGMSWPGPEFDGVVCFQVEPTGFTELGRVASVVHEAYPWTLWRRAAFIGDVLYAVTPAGVRAVQLDDFETPTSLVLTPAEDEFGGDGFEPGGGGAVPGEPGAD